MAVIRLRRRRPPDAPIRVTLSPNTLNRVDALVDPGFYGSRADFVRAAVQSQLAAHDEIGTAVAAALETAQAPAAPVGPPVSGRLLRLLRCPTCGGTLTETGPTLLACSGGHEFPLTKGIPRLYEGARRDTTGSGAGAAPADADLARTQDSFDHEWAHHRLGDPTWYVDTPFRVGAAFLYPLRIPAAELAGLTVLDAGCGNGSQSIAYAEHVAEVIALDLSRGVELGHALLQQQEKVPPDRVHFVQADLRHPPLAAASVDVVHAHGVLHHTPDTRDSLRRLTTLLRPGGTCYAWLYTEGFVTPAIRATRRLTTRMPLRLLDRAARVLAPAFAGGVAVLNRTGLRSLPAMTRRSAALTLLDVFAPPHMHHHTPDEVMGWFHDLGYTEVWSCLHSKRGFAVCGRLPGSPRCRTSEVR